MSWFKLTDEERREWRQHPTTVAYFETLREQIEDAKDRAVSALCDDNDEGMNTARRMAGKADGFETAIKIKESDE